MVTSEAGALAGQVANPHTGGSVFPEGAGVDCDPQHVVVADHLGGANVKSDLGADEGNWTENVGIRHLRCGMRTAFSWEFEDSGLRSSRGRETHSGYHAVYS